ncbi:MAG: NnrS family protein [Candidatus Thiodiazotropha lotti]|uniref:NnrS family protein n=1 Tax=Candidatus Thiodiazotropha lotti TaxID=2792787 RepID=A0A9E4K8L8_9GAMM|nr:NnrS family protein [Candidatus Thiodiazotropha lotti]ODC01083.1 short-chain dehydrogenase [Candidatus Thiodiazotropha endoloripes]MCG7940868.1 NnrS family protein [Candidatus Thiodiazotropha lotti]MCG7989179.1 NnrS family protein [Candidatus Thiodiazotropha lotti]MCG8002813.1 NnrS family protein [Candidatus Thiodiazotropha lotti]
MSIIPLGDPRTPDASPKGYALFALGFRPFFLLAAISGLTLMLLWLWFWLSPIQFSHYSLVGWHSHEMLFGFSLAIIAGFLLTAVRNWTGIDTPTGTPLALLAGLWFAGRLLPFMPSALVGMFVLIDLLFLPALIAALTRPLVKAENRINRLFIPLLVVMAIANLLYHLEAVGLLATSRSGISLMTNSILLLLIFVGGRVLPFFTDKAVEDSAPRFSKQREQAVYALFLLWALSDLLLPNSWPGMVFALGGAITQAWRLYDWHHPQIWKKPILWILYAGLAWLVIGFLLKAMAQIGLFADNLATHALTAGAIGVTTLGMMARVALGHTGREIGANRTMALAFILINIAVVMRVFVPITGLLSYQTCIMLSAVAWSICYLLFSMIYLPILIRPRIDGRPG